MGSIFKCKVHPQLIIEFAYAHGIMIDGYNSGYDCIYEFAQACAVRACDLTASFSKSQSMKNMNLVTQYCIGVHICPS
jgi:hypothetical protein